jgi:hypothetical protein
MIKMKLNLTDVCNCVMYALYASDMHKSSVISLWDVSTQLQLIDTRNHIIMDKLNEAES